MPITRIGFGSQPQATEAWDIHLLRGESTDELRKRLWVEDAAGNDWKPIADYAGDDIAVLFMPVFKIKHDDPAPEFSNFGINVHKQTGKVTVTDAWSPNSSPRNFIVEAFVTENEGGITPVRIPTAFIRVHVHLSVKQVWLTPALLSVRRERPAGEHMEDTSYFFTVRAQFDDDTVGDVTHSDELNFSPPDWFYVGVLGRGIRLPWGSPNTVAPFTITVTTSTKWNSKSGEAKVEVLRPWADEPAANFPMAHLLEGRPEVWDGTLSPENVPNILFLGCGFTDEGTFQLIADAIVHKVKRDPLLQPFGYLATSMNYWRLMPPAQQAGVSVRCEVQQFTKAGQLYATPMPSPLEAPPTSADWNLQHLIYMAGLPVPSDLNLVIDKDSPDKKPPPTLDALRERPLSKLDFQPLFDKWATTMRLDHPTAMIGAIQPYLVKQWMALADRTFIDEVNNFPGVALGTPPSAAFNEDGLLAFHDLRGSTLAELTAFFRRVKAAPRNGITVALDDPQGQAPELGNLWAEDRPTFAFDNRRYLTVLCNIPDGRANAGYFVIHTRLSLTASGADGDRFPMPGIPVAREGGRNALRLTLPTQNLSLAEPTWRVFAHELGHNFELGDEYVELAESFTGSEEYFSSGNLMSEAAVHAEDEPEKVDFYLIKWNWHRIRKASVITLPIEAKLDGIFHVFVRKGSGAQFALGDYVRLRKRERRAVIGRRPVTSIVEFLVEAIHKDNIDDPQDPFNMTIVLKNEAPVIDVSPFGPGSLIYLPVPAPDPIRDPILRPYLTLVSPAAEEIMTKIGGTMTGVACEIWLQMVEGGAYTQVPNPPSDAKINVPAKDLPALVGVYFGGHRYACGVLHPTGQCMMRNTRRKSDEDASTFCPVCRYILVEQIDPEQHWWIDRDYDKKYYL